MPTITVDYETFWDKKTYSLRKKDMDAEMYVLDPRFQAHGASVAVDDEDFVFLTHNELVRFYAGLDPNETVFVAHNALFDASITVWRYGFLPALFIDTMGLANVFIRPHTGSSSLDSCAAFEGLPLKTNVLDEVSGMRTEDIIKVPGLWDRFARYAVQDGINCRYLFRKYYPRLGREDRLLLDWTVRNYVRGRLRIDLDAAQQAHSAAQIERDKLAAEAGITDPQLLRSTAKFADYLEMLGVEVDTKLGKNNAEIPAISKNDPFVQECLKHPDQRVVAAMKARLVFSSSMDLSRANRLMRMHQTTGGRMLLPLIFAAAHTWRVGGTNGVNITNFKRGGALRKAIVAPAGKVMVEVDSSQAEARLCAWLANCKPMLDAFSDPNRDLYCEYGTHVIYKEPITKKDPRRQTCKVVMLAAQYGLGKVTLLRRLQAAAIVVTEEEAANHISEYRAAYPEILGNGQEFVDMLVWCVNNDKSCEHKGFVLSNGYVILPSGRPMIYSKMRTEGRNLFYWSPRYKSWQKLYAGSINENWCQALCYDIVKVAVAKFREDTVMFAYDAFTRLVLEEAAEEEGYKMRAAINTPPPWAEGLPLASDMPKIKTHW